MIALILLAIILLFTVLTGSDQDNRTTGAGGSLL